LVDDPAGNIAARISWRAGEGAWRGPILLQQGEKSWEAHFAVALDAFETEQEARDSQVPILQPRWGVLDDGRMHWFESFVPSTGLELESGERIAIVAGSPPEPIQIQRGRRPPKTFHANMQHLGQAIRYEAPGFNTPAAALHVWPGGAVAHVRFQGEMRTPRPWKQGQILALPLPGADLQLRLDELRMSAIVVRAMDSPFQELEVVTGAGQTLFLREGEPCDTAGGATLVYRREPTQDAAYELASSIPRKGYAAAWEPFAQVTPGETAHHGGYRFTVLHPDIRLPETTRLHVDQRTRLWEWIAAGGVLCAAAWVVSRLRPV
jgi:hypothetical protein